MKWQSKIEQGDSAEAAQKLARELGISPLAATVLVNRGMRDVEVVNRYLNPQLSQLTHPFAIRDMEKAVRHILATQTTSGQPAEKLRVFTDYDVDGTTGAALLTWFFRDMGFNFDVVQPDRFKDGYGLNPGAIDQAHADGVTTMITVDCGITNFEAARRAEELGVKLIIVDHHQIDPVQGLPPALAIVDPQRADDESGRKELCGCALAFYLCMGIRSVARDQGFYTERGKAEPNLKNLLDLVVIATAADMVPLVGDNRTLVRHGLQVLRNTDKPGLRALIETAGIEVKLVSPTNLGFALGPRINASGRMGSAETAYRVLTTTDAAEGRRLAQELEEINKKRADLQNLIWDDCRAMIDKGIEKGLYSNAVVVASKDWHEGVVGIVASKVTDHFKRPAIVMAIREDGICKGSVRSWGGYNVLDALHASKQFLKGYGGHKFAAGLSLDPAQLDEFIAHYNDCIRDSKPLDESGRILQVESYIEPEALTRQAIEELEKLAPFGPGNPEPVFAVTAGVQQQNVLKGRHLKLKLSGAKPGFMLEGIWFNAAERLEYTQLVERSARGREACVFAGIPELNRFMGRVTPTLRIKTATGTAPQAQA